MDLGEPSNTHGAAIWAAVARARAVESSDLCSQRTAVATPRAIVVGRLSAPHKNLVQPHLRCTPATTMPPVIAPIAIPPMATSARASAESCGPLSFVTEGVGPVISAVCSAVDVSPNSTRAESCGPLSFVTEGVGPVVSAVCSAVDVSPNSTGSDLVILSRPTSRSVRWTRSRSATGMGPVSWLPPRSRTVNAVRSSHAAGMGPLKRLPPR